MTRPGRIRVWQQQDKLWRWQWAADEEGGRLVSHKAFDSADEAVASAGAAYPGVERVVDQPRRRKRRARRAALGVVVAVVVVAAGRRRGG